MKASNLTRTAARSAARTIVVSLCLAIVAAGCSGGSKPTTIKVRGKVTYKNAPVTEGSVIFTPAKAAAGSPTRPAVAAIKPDGTYELASFGAGDGVVPGDYTVTVRTGGDVSIENPGAPQASKTPAKYADPAQSTLKATVPANHSGTLEVNFTLED